MERKPQNISPVSQEGASWIMAAPDPDTVMIGTFRLEQEVADPFRRHPGKELPGVRKPASLRLRHPAAAGKPAPYSKSFSMTVYFHFNG